tara:strand:+ start:675 stop:863 length:189 start_codon:yes stop_codon:yes gene_type:complete
MNKENEDKNEDEEYEMVFEPDEALILAINEINNLKDLFEGQSDMIEELKSQIDELKNSKLKK